MQAVVHKPFDSRCRHVHAGVARRIVEEYPAVDETGYHNLCYLVSAAFERGFYGKPRIDWPLLRQRFP